MFPIAPAAPAAQAPHSAYRGTFQDLVNNVIQCAQRNEFLRQVVTALAPEGNMNFTINQGVGASCNHATRVIRLSYGRCECYLTQELIQEMTNLWFGIVAIPLDQRTRDGEISRDTYVKIIELMEFGGVRNVVNSFDANQISGGLLGCAHPIDKNSVARRFVQGTTDHTVLQLDLDDEAFNEYFESDFLTNHKANIVQRYNNLAGDKGWSNP